MAVAELALIVHMAAAGERPSAGAIGILVLILIAGMELAVLIAFARMGRSDGSDGDDAEDGDDPGWGKDRPRTPPPDAPFSWPEFERQFAEHVAALERDRQLSASSSSRRGCRAFAERPECRAASAHARKQAAPADVVQLAAARSSVEPDDGTT
jgi:hypothetical protein